MTELRALTPEELVRVERRWRNPPPGSRAEAARESGVDLTLALAQLRRTPAERVRVMLEMVRQAEEARGAARRRQP